MEDEPLVFSVKIVFFNTDPSLHTVALQAIPSSIFVALIV